MLSSYTTKRHAYYFESFFKNGDYGDGIFNNDHMILYTEYNINN